MISVPVNSYACVPAQCRFMTKAGRTPQKRSCSAAASPTTQILNTGSSVSVLTALNISYLPPWLVRDETITTVFSGKFWSLRNDERMHSLLCGREALAKPPGAAEMS